MNKHNYKTCQCASCKSIRGEYRGKSNPNFKHDKTHNNKCMDCGKHCSPLAKRCQKCNGKLSGENRKGINNPIYIDGRTNKKYYCIDCHKQLGKTAYKGIKRCHSCENKRRYINPENHPMYIDGTALSPYPFEWRKIRIYIRIKYNYKCIICNKFAKHVHHIDYNKNNCDENNLILLCHKHHQQTNGNRDYWYAYFRYLKEND